MLALTVVPWLPVIRAASLMRRKPRVFRAARGIRLFRPWCGRGVWFWRTRLTPLLINHLRHLSKTKFRGNSESRLLIRTHVPFQSRLGVPIQLTNVICLGVPW